MYLCSQRSQFGEPPPKRFGRCPKFFQTVSENLNKLFFFPRKKLSPKLFPRTSRRQFWQPCRNTMAKFARTFCHIGETFSFNVRQEANKNKVSQNVHLSSKCSSGRVESSFDKPVRKKITIPQIFFNQCLKTLKVIWLFPTKKDIPSNCFSGQVEGNFDNPAEEKKTKAKNVLPWAQKNFVQGPNRIKLHFYFVQKKIVFPKVCQSAHQKHFWQPYWNILPLGEKWSPIVLKR